MTSTYRRPHLGLVLLAGLLAIGCGNKGGKGSQPPEGVAVHERPAPPAEPAPMVAEAEVAALGGSGVTGTVTFTQVPGIVKIEASIAGLTPGAHGFHVHEWGDCSAADGSSAGPHFNPGAASHAGPDAPACHVGDMGNLMADAEGRAVISLQSRAMSVGSGDGNVLGRSVIIHADPDDLTTQPTGNSGARIGCGIIRLRGGDTTPVLPPPT